MLTVVEDSILLFRVLLLYAGENSPDKLSNELLESITQTTAAHAIGKHDPFFKIHFSVFSLIPQMLDLLHLLRVCQQHRQKHTSQNYGQG